MRARVRDASGFSRERILFLGEGVTLAHIVRLKVLAQSLDPRRYEVWFATSHFDPMIFAGTGFHCRKIDCMAPTRMVRRIAGGRRPYDQATLHRYVSEDLTLLETVQPALVVGDFRLSLAVSAPKAGVPYAALINAYWSPAAVRDGFPIPEHPLIDFIGFDRVKPHFAKALPFVFDHFARPVNALRKAYGLPPIGSLLEVLTFGDVTLYPDVPELTPVAERLPNHYFIGPVLWAPRAPLPWFWDRLRPDRPCIYVTLGSSGDLRALDAVIEAVDGLRVEVIVSTAGRPVTGKIPDNVWVSDFVPGDLAARRSDLVICNGGSATGYQALHEGVPVLGLPSNLDQYLAMTAIERTGAGELLRAGGADSASVRAAIERMLGSGGHRQAAQRAKAALRSMDPLEMFPAIVRRTVGGPRDSEESARPRNARCIEDQQGP
ncbi:MAG: nucleotide disphospho-sugar-binding domain-containing protein [Polyangiaceae bacterium]